MLKKKEDRIYCFRSFSDAEEAWKARLSFESMPNGVLGLPQLAGCPVAVLGGKNAKQRESLRYRMPDVEVGKRTFELSRGSGPLPTSHHNLTLQAMIAIFAMHFTESGKMYFSMAELAAMLGQHRSYFSSKSIREAIARYSDCVMTFENGYQIKDESGEAEWVSWSGPIIVESSLSTDKKEREGKPHWVKFHPEIVRLIKSEVQAGKARLYSKQIFMLLDPNEFVLYRYLWSFGTDFNNGKRNEITRHLRTLGEGLGWHKSIPALQAWLIPKLGRLKELKLLNDFKMQEKYAYFTLTNVNKIIPNMKQFEEFIGNDLKRKYEISFYTKKKKLGAPKKAGGHNRIVDECREKIRAELINGLDVMEIAHGQHVSRAFVYDLRVKVYAEMEQAAANGVFIAAETKSDLPEPVKNQVEVKMKLEDIYPPLPPCSPAVFEPVKKDEFVMAEGVKMPSHKRKLFDLYKVKRPWLSWQDRLTVENILSAESISAITYETVKALIMNRCPRE